MADGGFESEISMGVSPDHGDGEQPALFHCHKEDRTWNSISESDLE